MATRQTSIAFATASPAPAFTANVGVSHFHHSSRRAVSPLGPVPTHHHFVTRTDCSCQSANEANAAPPRSCDPRCSKSTGHSDNSILAHTSWHRLSFQDPRVKIVGALLRILEHVLSRRHLVGEVLSDSFTLCRPEQQGRGLTSLKQSLKHHQSSPNNYTRHHFFIFSFLFIFLHFSSFSSFSFIFFHVLSCSFIFFHFLSFSVIFFHFLSWSFIFFFFFFFFLFFFLCLLKKCVSLFVFFCSICIRV